MDHEDSGKHFSFLRLLYQRILGRIRAFLRYCSTHPYYQWFKTLKAILPLIWWIRSLCLPISHHTYVERCVPNLVRHLTYVSAQRSVGSGCIGQVCFLIIDIVSYWVSYRFLFIELFFGITLAYTIQSFYCWRIFVSEYDVLRVFESWCLYHFSFPPQLLCMQFHREFETITVQIFAHLQWLICTSTLGMMYGSLSHAHCCQSLTIFGSIRGHRVGLQHKSDNNIIL